MTHFEALGISSTLTQKLQSQGVVEPTPIQQLVIPRALNAENILAQSQTGSGKTLAYLLPLLDKISDNKRALILAPTRELVQQIGEVCRKISDNTLPIKFVTIYGGVEYEMQKQQLSEDPTIIISTVGRLLDLVNQGVANLDNLDFFVLDEVDQMVDLGFRDDILQLATFRLPSAQTLCFSATLPSQVEDIVTDIMPSGYFKAQSQTDSLAVERIEQSGYYVSAEMMDHLLIYLLNKYADKKSVIFTRSRKMADRLSLLLRQRDIFAEAMHSDRSQTAREHILSRFRSGETRLLVATDVIARGIDIDDIDIVYNYGLPLEAEQYIHRIGRTARAGRLGKAVSLCNPQEKPLIDKVCKLMKLNILMSTSHPYATPDIIKILSNSQQFKKRKK